MRRVLFLSTVVVLCIGLGNAASLNVPQDVNLYSIFDVIIEIGGIDGLKKVVAGIKEGKVDYDTCRVCEGLLGFFQKYLRSGKDKESLAKILEGFCVFANIVSPHVCKGAIERFKDEVLYMIEHATVPLMDSCGVLLGPECGPLQSKEHNWTVALPTTPKPTVKPFPQPQPGKPVLKVLHLSDTHYDPEYEEGSSADCGDPLCCRTVSGSPKKAEDAAGKWGDHRSCDLPYRTLEHMLKNVADNHKIDYVVWTGDLPPHDVWVSTREENLNNIRNTAGLIKKYLPSVPVFPAVGNHESVPTDSFPVQEFEKFSSAWLYNTLVDVWGQWLPNSTFETIRRTGSYSVKVKPSLKIISLNNIYCYRTNWWVAFNSNDPFGHLAWLVKELQESEDAGEKVHLIAHVPPGTDCIHVWSHNFHNIVSRYESTIVAQFYGHTHKDEVKIFYDPKDSSRATALAYIAPSVTTFTGHNPSYRIYTVEGDYQDSSHTVVDHETYLFNLMEANRGQQPKWSLEYSAASTFNMTSLTPDDWDKVITNLHTDNELFNKFHSFYRRPAVENNGSCDDACRKSLLCQMRTTIPRNYSNCKKP